MLIGAKSWLPVQTRTLLAREGTCGLLFDTLGDLGTKKTLKNLASGT